MHFLKKIVDFYIFSNIHVALAGFSLTKITLLKFGISSNLTPIFVALSILISYNFIRFFEIKTNRLDWFREWFFRHTYYLLLLSVLATILIVYITFFSIFNLNSLYILLPFAFMTIFYAVPLFKIGKVEVSFRNFPSIKIFSIVIAWAGITVFFPLYEAEVNFNSMVFIEFFQRIVFLIAITLPFDIRDMAIDSKSLKTLPQLFGIKTVKKVGYLLLVLFIFLEFTKGINTNSEIYIAIIIAIIAVLLLRFSNPDRKRYYTSFWVESIPIIWLILVVAFLKL
ncbi:hypothetical protein [Lutibacter sp.]